MEYSLFMIKPCAYKNKNEILDILNEKLNVLFTKDFVLNEDFLNKLYNNEKNETFKAINVKQLKDKPACIGIVSGIFYILIIRYSLLTQYIKLIQMKQ